MTLPRMYSALFASAAAIVMTAGCATKTYVSQQTAPLVDHVNQLDTETAQNTNQIRAVDQKTQAGIAQVNQSTQQAISTAQATQTQADQVKSQLDQTSNQISSLDATVANLDQYKQTNQATVHFALNKYALSPEAQQTLDQMVSSVASDPHAIVEVKGYTDTTGPVSFNDKLSRERADAVVQYLEEHNVAPHRIFLIGLGENQPAAPNTTLAGRKENRRVDLTVLVNNLDAQPATQQTGQIR